MPAREQLDSDLGVSQWLLMPTSRPAAAPVDDGAPSWWHGPEEASDAFLRFARTQGWQPS